MNTNMAGHYRPYHHSFTIVLATCTGQSMHVHVALLETASLMNYYNTGMLVVSGLL